MWLSYKFLSSIFVKGTKAFHFIKHNNLKISLSSQTHSQSNGDLIMFFGNQRIRYFKLLCSIVNTKERTNKTKKSTINIVRCSKS